MKDLLKEKTLESLAAVAPITVIVLLISMFLIPMDLGMIVMFMVGAVFLVIGMGLFQMGADMAMMPLGEGLGVQLSKAKRIITIVLITFAMGAIITIAEPDLQVLASQVPSIPNNVLIWTIALGVGIFFAMSILRILFKVRLSTILIILYTITFIASFFTPANFLSVAFDSGGVTTGPITVPFIMAMGVGFASVRSDKDASDDSFGLLGISSIGPILMVILLGIFYQPEASDYTRVEILNVHTTDEVVRAFGHGLPAYAHEVLMSLLPIVAVFILFQLLTRRNHRKQNIRSSMGFLYTFLGLVLFLTGVGVGFAPVGSLLGSQMAASSFRWFLIPVGMLIGFYIVKAEPAIQVLNHQVQNVTNGAISAKAMNYALSLGVAVSVGLGMMRALTGLSIYWLIIPGYLIALILSRFVPKLFVGIAFDSGGVASGPMTSTFLLPLSIGVSEAVGGNVMTDAFGIVAMVAMTPLIAIQIMGGIYQIKAKRADQISETTFEDLDAIVELEEE